MCVIMLSNKTRPTDEMIKRAWDTNSHGGGAAWREGDEVVWKKGIKNVDEMLALLHEIPLPFVSHFRIQTIGGVKPSLTHPFLVGSDASTELEGRTRGAVLFHNGNWSDWNDKALDAAISSNSKVPIGDWSDSRAMAWMVHLYGWGFMELLTQQKAIIWSPTDYRLFTGRDGWDNINDVWCSNDNFWTRSRHTSTTSYHRRNCKSAGCSGDAYGEGEFGYCFNCREKRKNEQERAKSSDTDSEDHSRTHTNSTSNGSKTTIRGDSAAALTAMTGRTTPLVDFLTLEDAKQLHERGGMSKSKWKDYQKAWRKLSGDKNQSARAVKKLIYISNIVAKELLHGTVH